MLRHYQSIIKMQKLLEILSLKYLLGDIKEYYKQIMKKSLLIRNYRLHLIV